MFHAKYDSSFWDFGGMNYPFYENIVYTDAHPLLSWIIGKVGLVNYGIGILNLLMLFSYPISSIFLFKIFRHYKLPNNWAIIAAVVIAFMSPQVFRMTGHFSMSYVFAIPIMWWLLIKSINEKKFVWSLITTVYMTIFFFTHPYLGMILAFFSVFFWIAKMISDRKSALVYFARILIQIAIPFLIFQGGVLLTDTHVDRMATPAGFYHYHASWKSLLLAHHGPMNYLNHLFGWKVSNWESWSYVGLSTIVFFFIGIFYAFKQRKNLMLKKIANSEMGLFLIVAYLILLFSFCFPMKFDFMHWVADVIGPLKQFRILGRFSWIFFYVISVFAIVSLYRIGLKKEKQKLFQMIFFAGMIFSVLEFSAAHLKVASKITASPNSFLESELSPDLKSTADYLVANDYDAIIFIPFNHMSSENIMILGTEEANFQSMVLSYHTGIPLFNSTSSRMSVTEASLFNNFFGPEFVERELLQYVPEDAKVAVIRNQDYLKEEELKLEWSSDLVYENETFSLFEFNSSKWNNPIYFELIAEKENEANVELGDGFRADTAGVWYHYLSYDENDNKSFLGNGAQHEKKNSWNILLTLEKSQLDPGAYSVSFWYDIRADRPDGLVVAEQVFESDQEAIWFDQFDIKQSKHIVNDWCYVQLDFTFEPGMEKINILHTGNGSQRPFYIDEMLVQKQGESPLFKRVIIEDVEYISYNNMLTRADSFSK